MADTPEAIDVDAARKRLMEMRAELRDLVDTTEEDRAPVELDQQRLGRLSRMDAMQDQAMAQEQTRRREVALQRIDAALKRIEDDEYGDCVQCGEPIEPKRLELDPAAPTCVSCAQG